MPKRASHFDAVGNDGSGKKGASGVAHHKKTIPHLSDELWGHVISYCDVGDLSTFMALRLVNCGFKTAAEKLLEVHLLDFLTAETVAPRTKYTSSTLSSDGMLEFELRSDDQNIRRTSNRSTAGLTFRVGYWSETTTREDLIEQAILQCDPEDMTSVLDVGNCNIDKARELLLGHGFVELNDFIPTDNVQKCSKWSWRVEVDFEERKEFPKGLTKKYSEARPYFARPEDLEGMRSMELCIFYFLRLRGCHPAAAPLCRIAGFRHDYCLPGFDDNGELFAYQFESRFGGATHKCEIEFSRSRLVETPL